MNLLDHIITVIPDITNLHEEAVRLDDVNLIDNRNIPYPGWFLYMSNDGAGQEGNIAFRLNENHKPVAAVMWVFDHESNLAVDMHDMNPVQPVTVGLPELFQPMMTAPSPYLWEFEGYPETFRTVYTTGMIWNTGSGWVYGDEQPDPDQSAHHFLYSFKHFAWVKKYRAQFAGT